MTAHPHTNLPPNEVCAELQHRLGRNTQGEVMFDAASRGRYATDASIYQVMPVGVFVPRTADDVATALAVARELAVPVLARGGGTSQCGQTVGAALVIDCSKHLRRVLQVDEQARTATVEPGLVLDHLNAQLKPLGLWYPVDVSTAAQATLGGMAGNNSCGSRSIAYGNMVHNVLGAQAWLSSGELLDFGPVAQLSGLAATLAEQVHGLARAQAAEIESRWPRVMRRVGGYNLDIFHPMSERPYTADDSVNLAHLLVGSEGTLAFTRSLTLGLAELPRHRVLGVVNFARFRSAMASAQHIVRLLPTAVELVDRTMIELSLGNPAFSPVIETALMGRPDAILLVEFAGPEREPLLRKLRELVALMGDIAAELGEQPKVVEMPQEAMQKAVWEVRKAGLNIMMSLRGDGKPVSFIEDCAVPLEHLADYTDALTEVFARHGTRGTWYAHASVGTLHVRPILDMRRDGAARMRTIAEEAAALVRRYRGAYSGEHGDGLCRGEWIRWQFGERLDEAFAAIKQAFDPAGLFNPGKIIDPPRMDDGALFRFPPEGTPRPYRRIPLKPVLDWSAWNVQADPVTEATTAPGSGGDVTHGLAGAVEMCNNNGHCRHFDAGTMCPSYRVTRDEQHVTRGRANTLRLALSGQLGPEGLAGDEVAQVLDLCVSCKGCKRDCPTGVDMARMKIEAMAQRKARQGFTAADRAVASLADQVDRAAAWPGFAAVGNALGDLSWLRRVAQRRWGLSATRRLPRLRRDTFWAQPPQGLVDARTAMQIASHVPGDAAAPGAVVLFVDTFNGGFEAENAHAAVAVLQAAGYAVHAVKKQQGHHCCGRTHLAVGDVQGARDRLGVLLQALLPLAQSGLPILGLEPSCLYTLRDEALSLGLGDAATTVARQAQLFDVFLASEAAAGRVKLPLRSWPEGRPLLVHGHCHQKAFGEAGPVLQLLRLIPNAQPQLIESSCCGMAGAFGYEARHQAVSMQMAELKLFPALRAQPDAMVVADGTSCRHQIADGVQRRAVHAAVCLAGRLGEEVPDPSA